MPWEIYLVRAQLSDVTVQTSLPTPTPNAARRSLEAAFPARPTPLSPQSFTADLQAWMDDTNAALPSTLMPWSAERTLMLSSGQTPELMGCAPRAASCPTAGM